jgi:MFS family permease
VPAARMRFALSGQAAAQSVGLGLGPTLGGLLTQTAGWRAVYWINVPVGCIAVVAGRYLLPRTRRLSPAGSFDWPGAVLLAVATSGLLLEQPAARRCWRTYLRLCSCYAHLHADVTGLDRANAGNGRAWPGRLRAGQQCRDHADGRAGVRLGARRPGQHGGGIGTTLGIALVTVCLHLAGPGQAGRADAMAALAVLAAAAAVAALIAAAIRPLGSAAGQAHEIGTSGAFG